MAAIALKPRVKGAGMPLPAPDPMDEDYSEDMAEGGVEDDPDEDEEDSAKLDDTEILSILDAEKQQSIGFENGVELERKRRTSLEYSKGEMSDVASLPNRSKATASDIADAIETVMPDLMEIFTGGEDVATFAPIGEEDEEAAQQETDYVLHVAFQKLRGFLLLYTAIKDALQVDTGILKTWWVDNEEVKEEKLEGITSVQMQMLSDNGAEIVSSETVEPGQPEPANDTDQAPDDMMAGGQPLPLFNVTVRTKYDKGCIKSVAIDPNNLTVASDATLDLDEMVYLALRSYPRAQMLVDQGFKKEKVAKLGALTQRNQLDQTEQARDVAGESTAVSQDSGNGGPDGIDGKSMMRVVEIHEHYIRADFDQTGKSQLWCVVTDSDCKTLLHKKKVDRHGISFGTPFIQAHRFYGMSLAEKLIEVQKIKTALLRMMLDSGYFAMNQRTEVAMDQANEHTISDLMRNEPMSPVRSRNGQAVRPLQAGQLGFDVGMMLEYTSTMAEQRTGVVRNAQGLNPDSLHETKGGMQALQAMAQKRVKMIARVLAETLVKGWFLDIHALSRKHATRAEKLRLRGRWVDIDPSEFGDRSDMTIEVGVGSGGKEMEMAGLSRIMDMQKEMIVSGIPSFQEMASPKKVWNASTRFARKAGFKSPESFFEDPDELAKKKEEAKLARQQAGQPEPEEPPSPEQMKVKGELELAGKKHQDTMTLEAEKTKAKFASDQQATQAKMQADQQASAMAAQQAAAQADRDFQLKQMQIAADERTQVLRAQQEVQLRRYQIDQEIEMKRQQLNAELASTLQIEKMKIDAGVYSKPMKTNTTDIHPGGGGRRLSDIQRKGREAEHELKIMAEANATFREKCLSEAIQIARLGDKDKAYEKLLMVIAIDGVRAVMQGHVDSAVMDKAANPDGHPNN